MSSNDIGAASWGQIAGVSTPWLKAIRETPDPKRIELMACLAPFSNLLIDMLFSSEYIKIDAFDRGLLRIRGLVESFLLRFLLLGKHPAFSPVSGTLRCPLCREDCCSQRLFDYHYLSHNPSEEMASRWISKKRFDRERRRGRWQHSN
jgi:hypothetical protein